MRSHIMQGLLALLLFVLAGTEARAAYPVPVYRDALHGDWQDWSWSSTLNFADSTVVHDGARAISVSQQACGGFYLHTAALDTTPGRVCARAAISTAA